MVFVYVHDSGLCINRNILECKDEKTCTLGWAGNCINRNILECKVVYMLYHPARDWVLIETYWNVKVDAEIIQSAAVPVLIETYWNVKQGIENVSTLRQ